MTTAIEVRHVDGSDWHAWRDIRLRSLQDAPDAFGSTWERELRFTREDWTDRLDGDGASVLAYAGEEPVAMGAAWPYADGRAMIVAMWTDPAWRGRGLATRVLDALVQWAREHDRRPDLWVTDGNPEARRVYERYGFVATGEQAPLRDGSPLTKSRLVLPRQPPAR